MKITNLRPCLLSLLLIANGAAADYVAYSKSEKGSAPLPETIDDIEAKYLLNIEWGEYAGKRARLGVLEVDNRSSSSSFRVRGVGGDIDYSVSSTGVPVDGIEAIVIDSLNQTNRFRLVERTELGSVLAEQDLATSGRVAAPSGAATGKVLGAEYLVQFVVTDYESDTGGKDVGLGGLVRGKVPVLGGLKVKNREGRVGMNLRLIDATTSEIVFTKQIESTIKESGLAFGGGGLIGDVGLGGFMNSFSKTPIGQAVIAGVNEGVFELIKQVGASSAEGSIVKADASQIYVNLGQGSVASGDVLEIWEKGEELIDPETGISLGGSDTLLGTAEVVSVQEKFSIARPVSLSSTPNRGDKVKSTKAAAALEFASSWSPPR